MRGLAEGDGQHSEVAVETKREVSGTGVAQPEMFTSVELPLVAVVNRADVRGKGFRQEELAMAKGEEGCPASGIGTFMEHQLVQSSLLLNFSAREIESTQHAGYRSAGE